MNSNADNDAMLRIGLDFMAKSIHKCSKACITGFKTAPLIDAEKTCMTNCISKHSALLGEAMHDLSNPGGMPAPGGKI